MRRENQVLTVLKAAPARRGSQREKLQRAFSASPKYEKVAPKLSEWMDENLPGGLTVFVLPAAHRVRMRTTNMLERVHEEINCRTQVTGLFPNEASLLRLVSAILMELSEEWETGEKYLNMDVESDLTGLKQNKFYRKNFA